MTTNLTTIRLRAAVGVVFALLAIGASQLRAEPAFAQGAPAVCPARDSLLTLLKKNHGEVPVVIGPANGAIIEQMTQDGVTWTLILTSPKGMSCLIASGDGWGPLAPTQSGPAV